MSNRINYLKLTFKYIKNPLSLILFRLGFKDEILVKTKKLGNFLLKNNGKKNGLINIILTSQISLNSQNKKDLIKFIKDVLSDKKIINLNGINYLNNSEILVLSESFFDEDIYSFSCDLKGKIIIDVGGNIGDTALQFAKQGAVVYSFEPVPPIYDIALKNINLNPDLKDNIHFFNYAISDKKGKIKISYKGEGTSTGSSTYSQNGTIYEVDTITMENIINNIGCNVDLLKLDCEGCEYKIVSNSDLSFFKEVFLEYHQFITGIDYQVLIDNLESQGFCIEKIHSPPFVLYSPNELGFIKAVNKNFNP